MQDDSPGHALNLDAKPVTPLAQLANILKPGATGTDLVTMLDDKVERTLALHWRSGRRGTPRWALELLAAKIQARASAMQQVAESIRSVPDRPGLSAGAKNLAAWHARRNKLK